MIDVHNIPTKGLCRYFLMLGWLYETHSISLISDDDWDYLCKRIDKEWDEIPDEGYHKHLIHRGSLETGTAMYLTYEYVPKIAQSSCLKLLERHA